MLTAIAKAVVHSLGLRPPARRIEVFADDVFIVSYPKSGNSWVRFPIAHLVAKGRAVDFSSVQRSSPASIFSRRGGSTASPGRGSSRAMNIWTRATGSCCAWCATRATWSSPTITTTSVGG